MVQARPKPASPPLPSDAAQASEPIVLQLPPGLLTDELLLSISALNDDLRFERNAEGALEVSPPAGLMSDDRSGRIYAQILAWSQSGHTSSSSGGFRL